MEVDKNLRNFWLDYLNRKGINMSYITSVLSYTPDEVNRILTGVMMNETVYRGILINFGINTVAQEGRIIHYY